MITSSQFRKKLNISEDETILWSGQPEKPLHFNQLNFVQLIFGIIFIGVVAYWLYKHGSSCLNQSLNNLLNKTDVDCLAPVLFGLFALVFIALFRPIFEFLFWLIYKVNKKFVYYAITKKRVVIRTGYFNKYIQVFDLHSLSDICYDEDKNKYGTISIIKKTALPFLTKKSLIKYPLFEGIADVKTVYEQIIEIKSLDKINQDTCV